VPDGAPPAGTAAPALEWTSWPARDEGLRSVLLTLLLAAIIALLFLAFGQLGWIGAVLLPLSLARYYLPTRYELGEKGLTLHFLGGCRLRRWDSFRRYYPHRIGVHLSPFEAPSPLDPFRGQFLRFSGNREAVLRALERHGLRKAEKRVRA
jgi:hypothetical protein